jgi:hypothetical protein
MRGPRTWSLSSTVWSMGNEMMDKLGLREICVRKLQREDASHMRRLHTRTLPKRAMHRAREAGQARAGEERGAM